MLINFLSVSRDKPAVIQLVQRS